MRASTALLVACIAAGFAVLAGLGTWQVQRLAWKEALIERVDTRIAGPPRPLREIERLWGETGDVDYWPVEVAGEFDHDAEIYSYLTWKGEPGWNVITPLRLDDGRAVLVNRGFVPDDQIDPQTRPGSQPAGPHTVTGLARNPLLAKPNAFLPDADLAAGKFYWRDFTAMTRAAGLEPASTLSFMVDAGPGEAGDGLPVGGTTLIAFSNNHLQYAVTWYGLALALAGVGIAFMWSRARG